jgi:molecular chaperone DnaK (HSP70)
MQPLTRIDHISIFEIGINDELNHKEYLAQDLIYKAGEDNNTELVNKAFELVPDNIKVQKLAFSLDLLEQTTLKYNIGVSLVDDDIKLLAKKGDKIPSSFTTIVRTSFDNQTKSITDIVYGKSLKASQNSKLISFVFDKIPPLPKGEAEIKFTFSIDKDGSALIEQLSLNNGEKILKKIKKKGLVGDYKNSNR